MTPYPPYSYPWLIARIRERREKIIELSAAIVRSRRRIRELKRKRTSPAIEGKS